MFISGSASEAVFASKMAAPRPPALPGLPVGFVDRSEQGAGEEGQVGDGDQASGEDKPESTPPITSNAHNLQVAHIYRGC